MKWLPTLFFIAVVVCKTASANTENLPQESRVPGGIALIDVGAADEQLTVKFRDYPVLTVLHKNRQIAVVGLPLSIAIGTTNITVTDARHNTRQIQFDVIDKSYPVQKLSVAPNYVNPPADVQERIDREAAEMNALFRSFTAITPALEMIKPAEGPWSSAFGLRREFNGEARNPHSGADIAAPKGAPVQAAADGVVVLAKDLYFNGNTVIIDHGQGLLSLYCHLDEISTGKGQKIAAGTRLGNVGATGRVTGPHLHWSVSLSGARIDPALLLAH